MYPFPRLDASIGDWPCSSCQVAQLLCLPAPGPAAHAMERTGHISPAKSTTHWSAVPRSSLCTYHALRVTEHHICCFKHIQRHHLVKDTVRIRRMLLADQWMYQKLYFTFAVKRHDVKRLFFHKITWRSNDALANLKCAEHIRQTERMRDTQHHSSTWKGKFPITCVLFPQPIPTAALSGGSNSCQRKNWLTFWIKFYKISAKVPQIVLFLVSKVLPDGD